MATWCSWGVVAALATRIGTLFVGNWMAKIVLLCVAAFLLVNTLKSAKILVKTSLEDAELLRIPNTYRLLLWVCFCSWFGNFTVDIFAAAGMLEDSTSTILFAVFNFFSRGLLSFLLINVGSSVAFARNKKALEQSRDILKSEKEDVEYKSQIKADYFVQMNHELRTPLK
jgi:bacteriorhodopsin